MSQNQPNESPIETARKAVTATRGDKTARMAASHEARIVHEHALTSLKAEGTPAARKALLAAEDVLRMVELELAGSSERHDKATAELARLERESRLAAHAARAKEITFESFSGATSKAVQKIADARARLADAEAEAASIVRGFATEAEAVRSEAAQLGAGAVAVLDYGKVLSSLVAKAAGLPAGAILISVWAATAPAGVSPEAALDAVQHGVDARRVASLVAKLKDSTARAAIVAQRVVGGFPEASRGDRNLTACSRFNAAIAETHAAREALSQIGIGIPGPGIGGPGKISDAANAIPVDALSEKLSAAGPERVHALCLSLRMCAGLTMPGYPTAEMLETHRSEAAEKIIAQLEAMGLGEYLVRPNSPAHTPATIAPQGVAFAEVGAQAL